MGENAFNFLMVRAHIAGKRDDKLRIMLLKIVEGTEFRKARPMKEPECKSCDEVIQSFDRTLKLLDKTLIKAKNLLHDHPDSVILTEAYERLSGQGVDVKL